MYDIGRKTCRMWIHHRHGAIGTASGRSLSSKLSFAFSRILRVSIPQVWRNGVDSLPFTYTKDSKPEFCPVWTVGCTTHFM